MTLVPGSRLGPYEVIGLLGAGGMGEVYRARDHRLDRLVAVKVLGSSQAENAESCRRFEQEARTVAALNHPNILALYDIGEQDGLSFVVTELLEGRTLRSRLEEGPIPLDETLRFVTAIAQGLAAAHAKGVIHRDLKPENLFLTDEGVAKILDFGLARIQRPCGSEELTSPQGAWSVTASGVVMGTACYMSPEQARGEAVDARTDIFSFGCVLYEMLSGQKAFGRGSAVESLSAILHEEPPKIVLDGCPLDPSMERDVLGRCLAKGPQGRFVNADALVAALRAIPPGRDLVMRSRWARRAFALRRHAIFLGAAGVLLFGGLIGVWAYGQRGSRPKVRVLAVLPFQNQTGDPSLDFVADGFTALLTTDMMRVPGLSVVSDTSARQISKTSPGVSDFTRDVNADAVVEGRVLRSGSTLTFTVNLVGRNERILWGQPFQGTSSDFQTTERTISLALAARLAPDVQTARTRGAKIPEAFDLYMRAASVQNRDGYYLASKEAIDLLTWGLAIEPDFIEAKAVLADQLARRGYAESDRASLELATEMADAVLAQEPNQSDALIAKARALWSRENGFPHLKVLSCTNRVLSQNPSHVPAHFLRGVVLWHLGLSKEAETEFGEAQSLDPSNKAFHTQLGWILADDGRFHQAVEEFKRNPGAQEAYHLPLLLAYDGKRQEAWELAIYQEQHGPGSFKATMQEPYFLHSILSVLAADRGNRALALHYAARTKDEGESKSAFHHAMLNLAGTYALLGMKTEAMYWLHRCEREGLPSIRAMETNPFLARLRSDPDFQVLLSDLRERQRGWRKEANLPPG